MAGERILTIADSLEGPTGFATQARGICWALAKEYEVYHLGLQSIHKEKVTITIQDEPREVIQLPNIPRSKEKYDFGERSLPVILDEIKPDLLITSNDIQMTQHIPRILAPDYIKLKILDLPSKKLLSDEALRVQLEAEIRKYKEVFPRDIKYLMYCFTPDTEIITRDGVKKITDVKLGEEVLTLNPKTNNLEYKKVIDRQIGKYDGYLISIKGRFIDFLVTPDHPFYLNNMLMKAEDLLGLKSHQSLSFPVYNGYSGQRKEWFNLYEYFDDDYIIRAPKYLYSKLPKREQWKLNHANQEYFYEIKWREIKSHVDRLVEFSEIYAKSKSRNGERIPLRIKSNLFLSLAGWYIAEGYLDKHSSKIGNGKNIYTSYRVNISQENETYRKEIAELLENIGIKYHLRKSNISINGKFFYKLFKKLFHDDKKINNAKEKYIPSKLFEYEGLEDLFITLIKGDGYISKKGHRIFVTSSEKLCNSFAHLCFLLGYRPCITKQKLWNIYISDRKDIKIRRNHISLVKYKGLVFDITVEDNHLIIAGRNKKFNITHNCPHDGEPPMPQWRFYYEFADQVVAMSKYGQEIFRRFYNMEVPYIWHGVDTAIFRKIEDFKRPEHLEDKFIIGDIHRNQPRKQPIRLIEAFAKFAKDKDDVLLHLQKDWRDPFGWPLDYFVDLYGIRSKIIRPLPVGIDRTKVAELYNLWDINMSATAGEGFNIPIIEGFACGTPTIATEYTCFGNNTQVMTPNGIKYVRDLKVGDLVWTLNEKTGELEAKEVVHIEPKFTYDKLIHFKSRYIDIKVTPDHTMLVKRRNSKGKWDEKWRRIKAKDLVKKSGIKFPITAKWKGKRIGEDFLLPEIEKITNRNIKKSVKTKPLLRLIGWFIAEGFLVKDKSKHFNAIHIVEPKNGKFRDEVVNLIKDLGFKPIEKEESVIFYSIQIAKILEECYLDSDERRAWNKRIPRWILELDKEYLYEVFIGLVKGDGSNFGKYKEFRNFTTTSKQLAEDFLELCLKLGYGATLRKEKPSSNYINENGKRRLIKGKHEVYRISIRYKELEGYFKHMKGSARIEIVENSEPVWCVSIKDNHNLLVGENGRFMFCGNTHPELVVEESPSPRGLLVPYVDLYWDQLHVAAVRRALIDINKLVDAMETYYYDRELLYKHGENAKEWALKNVSWDKLQYEWLDIVKKVLNNG